MPSDADNQLDQKRLKNIRIEILRAEKENLNKRERGDDGMVEMLRKIIIDEITRPY